MAENKRGIAISYGVADVPPIHITIMLGIQQLLTTIGGAIAMPAIVANAACIGPDDLGRAELLGSLMFVNGISTLIQIYVGSRLPILQGASFAFIAPILAMGSIDEFKCPPDEDYKNGRIIAGSDEHRAMWMWRLVHIQGAVMLAGLFEMFLGATGLIGFMFRFVGPLTIAPTTALIGLGLVDDAVTLYAAKHWPIALLTLGLILLFCLYLCNLNVPIPAFSIAIKRPRHCKVYMTKSPFFGLFPVLLSIVISWVLCAILTATSALSDNEETYGYYARTDIRISQLTEASWFRFPYPGQWGRPRIFIALVLGMFAGCIASIVESIGDYCACARISGERPPPSHAINRGITAEGFGCLLAGAVGSGPGVTSYSENIGAIGITKVASRRVILVTAILLIIMGLINKIAAIFVSIPDPVIGGIFIAMFSMVASVGFSNLQFVNLNLTRNLLIFGLAIFLGLATPMWVKKNRALIKSGSDTFDDIIIVLLQTGMLVGGLIGFVLDNTVPGASRKDRGLDVFEEAIHEEPSTSAEQSEDIYDLPFIGNWIANKPIFRYIPVCPPFLPQSWSKLIKRKKVSEANNGSTDTPATPAPVDTIEEARV